MEFLNSFPSPIEEDLKISILLDQPDKLLRILSSRPDFVASDPDQFSWQAIFHNAIQGQPKILRVALENGANVHEPNPKTGIPPILEACRSKSGCLSEIWRTLLEFGADPNSSDGKFSVIQKAILLENAELLEALVAAGADVNGAHLPVPHLFFALKLGFASVFKALIELGASVDSCEYLGKDLWTVLCMDNMYPSRVEFGRILLEKNLISVNRNHGRMSPLETTVQYGNYEMFKLLLEFGADCFELDSRGRNLIWTLVGSYSGMKDIRIAHELLSRGVDPNQEDERGETPLSRITRLMEVISSQDMDHNSTSRELLAYLQELIRILEQYRPQENNNFVDENTSRQLSEEIQESDFAENLLERETGIEEIESKLNSQTGENETIYEFTGQEYYAEEATDGAQEISFLQTEYESHSQEYDI